MIDLYKCEQKLIELENKNEQAAHLLDELRTYIKETGAVTKYQQPEKFATTCLSYCDRIQTLILGG